MKKAIGIIILGLLWCNVGFAEQVELNCKDGVMFKDGQDPEPFDDPINIQIK